jgi:hypothetical protein
VLFNPLANRIATSIVSGSQSKQCTSSGACQTGFFGASFHESFLLSQGQIRARWSGSGAKKQEQHKVWHGTPIALLSVALFLS